MRPKKDKQGKAIPNTWLIDFYDQDSVRHLLTYRCTLAEAIATEQEYLLLAGKVKPLPSRTFTDLCDYCESICKNQRYWPTKKGIIAKLRKKFGSHLLNTLTVEHFKRYKAELEQATYIPSIGSKAEPRPYSIATINRYMTCLKGIIREGVDADMCNEYVLKAIKKVKLDKERNARLRYLETQEVAEVLLQKCQESPQAAYLYPIVLLALHTGMRRGELLNLRWSDLDFKNGIVAVKDTKNGERRDIPMSKRLVAVLTAVPRPIKDNTPVFMNLKTEAVFGRIDKSFKMALKHTNIKDFHFHDLRHTYASWLVMAGTPLATVQKLMGHKDIKMTLRYSHLSPDHIKTVTQVFDITIAAIAATS